MSEWFYAHAGERFGPMSMDDLRRAAADGKVKPADRAWTDGWPDWRPATDVPGLTFEDGGRDVGYFDDGMTPARAHATLVPYAPPTGDTGAWPLGEKQVGELADAVRQRRRQLRATLVFRGLALLHVVLVVLIGVAAVRGNSAWSGGVAAVIGGILLVGLVHLIAARGMRLNRRNGAWIGAAAAGLDLLACAGVVALALTGRLTATQAAITACSVAAVAFMLCVFVAFAAGRRAKRFRAMPAWCQEAVLAAETPRRL